MNEVKNNIENNQNSFIFQLHENSIFDIKLLNDLILDIYKLIKNFSNYNYTNSELIDIYTEIFDIYTYTRDRIEAHLHNDKNFGVKSLDENYYIYIDRLSFVMKCFLKKDYQEIEEYLDPIAQICNLCLLYFIYISKNTNFRKVIKSFNYE